MDIKNPQSGDLRTKIRIQYLKTTGSDDFADHEWVDIGNTSANDAPRFIKSAWYPLKGIEKFAAASTQSVDGSNVLIRYNRKINSQCRLIKDGIIYNILFPNDLDQHKHWMKLTVKAAVTSA